MMKRILKVLLVALMVVASIVRVDAKTTISQRVQNIINNMSSTDKVAQMIQTDTRWITPEEVAEYKIGSILSGGGAAPSSGNQLKNWADSANSYQQAVLKSGGLPVLSGMDAGLGNQDGCGGRRSPQMLFMEIIIYMEQQSILIILV